MNNIFQRKRHANHPATLLKQLGQLSSDGEVNVRRAVLSHRQYNH